MRKPAADSKFHHLETFVDAWDNFIITSHHEPDGDATGTEYALLHLLETKGKTARILNPDPPDSRFTYFQKREVFHHLEESPAPSKEKFALIIVDTSDIDHLGRSKTDLIPLAADIFVIDHHNSTGNFSKEKMFIDPNAAATTEIVYLLYKKWKVQIPEDVAWALFTGLVFDTGSFVYPKTSASSFQMAQELLEKGVRPKEVHSQLYERMTSQKLRLLAEVQSGFEVLAEERLAVQAVTQKMLQKTGAEMADSDNMINYPLKCSSIKVSAFFREEADGQTKVSLRSKGGVDMAAFASEWGGGGHTNAAGFTVAEGLEQLKPKVVKKLIALLHES